MASWADRILPPQPDIHDRLADALSRVRWVVIAVLVLLSIARPLPSRADLPMWAIVLLFGGYNLLVHLLRIRFRWLHSFARVAFLDLPMTALLYSMGVEIGGPLFSLLILGQFSAAASTTLRGSVVYTVAVIIVVAAMAPTFPLWAPNEQGLRDLIARIIVLVIVGTSATIIMRELWQKAEEVRSSRDEAQRLEELDRLRTEFIATISHDLRTPLTAARASLGMLELSGLKRLGPEEQELAINARRNTERLGRLIDDLLSFSQLKAGTLRLDREPLDLRAVVADAISAVHPLMRQKGQALKVDLPELLSIDGDPRRLEQVVVNILANAHRHTPAGTRVAVSGAVVKGEVRLAVRDEGPGIPPDELEAIFRRFHRVTPVGAGAGLGLAIAKGLVELHGGRIWAESEPGCGSTFHVALPHREGRSDR